MGNYLNSKAPWEVFQREAKAPYFVDKSELLKEVLQQVEWGSRYICITRPRRFGKTMAANMLSSFLSEGIDSEALFRSLKIGKNEDYMKYQGKFQVISITFNKVPAKCNSYDEYIERIENNLIEDLKSAYPQYNFKPGEAVWDILSGIYESEEAKFVFVLDEWDYIFHRDFVTERDKLLYLDFLNSLLKGNAFVEFAYMTGILPIAKYSSGSELNMFLEYTMITETRYSTYYGFTESEVDELYGRYLANCSEPVVTREGLRTWYNGYHTLSKEKVYNPRSVVSALLNNNLGSYWTSSGPYDEIFYYIEKNVDDVRNELALMVSGQPVRAKIREYAAVSMNLSTKNEIFSAMVVYGFLSYENGYVSIPNKELMDKFGNMLMKEPSLGYVYRLARESERMIQATLNRDVDTVCQILEFAHNTEVPLLHYNNEVELTAIVNLVYLAARDYYRIEREDKAGIGYVDFIFYPEERNATGIILELKVDHSAQEAIQQIKDKGYQQKFLGKMAGEPKYTGSVIAVGIAYDKKTKKHSCVIEQLA